MKITLLNGAATDSDSSLKTDRPGRNGLYGKKPTANVKMPMMREKLVAAISSHCCVGRMTGVGRASAAKSAVVNFVVDV